MKLNMIVGKKQIVLASLILILGVAVYINWTFANKEDSIVTGTQLSDISLDSGSDKNYGDAELVSGSAENSDDFLQKQGSKTDFT